MNIHSEKLLTDVKVLVKDTEELVQATASQTAGKIAELRDRAQESANHLKPQLAKVEKLVSDKAKNTANLANTYVHENPWTAVGVSAGIGLVIGLLISRR
jgi:ElaB/YqjD/DUF883 family membrane-anchored ribosome-binding protein